MCGLLTLFTNHKNHLVFGSSPKYMSTNFNRIINSLCFNPESLKAGLLLYEGKVKESK